MTEEEKAERAAKRAQEKQQWRVEVGARLKRARLEKNPDWSLNEITQKVEASGGAVSRAEKGERIPAAPILQRLAALYGVRLAWLTTGKGPMKVNDADRAATPLEAIDGFSEAVEEVRLRWPDRFRADSFDRAGKWIPDRAPDHVDALYLQAILNAVELTP